MYRHNESMLTKCQADTLTSTYCRIYYAWLAKEELRRVFIESGESNYWIYMVLMKCRGQILEDHRDSYGAEMYYNRNRDLYDHLQKHCSLVLKKRTRHSDDYLIEFIVKRFFFNF